MVAPHSLPVRAVASAAAAAVAATAAVTTVAAVGAGAPTATATPAAGGGAVAGGADGMQATILSLVRGCDDGCAERVDNQLATVGCSGVRQFRGLGMVAARCVNNQARGAAATFHRICIMPRNSW